VEKSHLDELIELETTYWWHVAKRNLVTELLRRHVPPRGRIIEGGFGAAGNLRDWRALGYQVTGLDAMAESIEHARQMGLDEVHQHDLHAPWPVEESSAAGVVLLDVLEHLHDPVCALRHAARALTPQGRILFTVPCYPWLYSEWDRCLGHYRRYTGRMIRKQVRKAGLRLEMLRHWNAFTLPAAIATRVIRRLCHRPCGSDFPRVPRWLNRALIGAAHMEQRLASVTGLPLGLSLVGVIRR
jgi:SAM-dependent methyltransferase